MIAVLATAAAAAFVLSFAANALMRQFARRTLFVDRPGIEPHKQHALAVPYGGGLAMGIAIALTLVGTWLATRTHPADDVFRLVGNSMSPVFLGAVALLMVGLIDDARPMRARTKLLAQGLVAAGVVWAADFRIDILGRHPVLAYTMAWLWMVLVTNAYNLLDHADGLSASVAAISACVLLSGSVLREDYEHALLFVVLISALGGFLCWNLPPARIYMGDGGSLPLGFLIAAGTLSVTFWPSDEPGSPLAVLAPVLINAIPLFDTAAVMFKRLRRGQPLMRGDRQHISHRLHRLGMSPRGSLAAVVALQVALAGGAIELRHQDTTTAIVVLAQAAGIVLAVVLLETSRDHDDD